MRKALTKNIREQVKAKFGGRCGYCGEVHQRLQIDHIHPVSLSYSLRKGKDVNDSDNLMPACFSCNNYKLNRSLEQFRTDLQEQVWCGRQYSLNFRLAERFGLIQPTGKQVKFYFESLDSMGERSE